MKRAIFLISTILLVTLKVMSGQYLNIKEFNEHFRQKPLKGGNEFLILPYLTISPESWDYGCVYSGWAEFHLTNSGDMTCSGFIDLITNSQFHFIVFIDGTEIWDPYPFSLQQGEEIQIDVYFTAFDADYYTANLIITSEQCNNLNAPLYAEGVLGTSVYTGSEPPEGGTTSPFSKPYTNCDTACINAYSNPGFKFDRWEISIYGNVTTVYDQHYCYNVIPYILNMWIAYFTPVVELQLRVFLEGPFNGSGMNNYLTNSSDFPLNQPYQEPPWNYQGVESLLTLPNTDVVDWVLVELRETSGNASTATELKTIAKKAAFLLTDGRIVDLDGTSNLMFDLEITENLFAIIWHRNHLGIMSAFPIVSNGGIYSYDFTTSADQVYGGTSNSKQLSSNAWGMISGDGNADGLVNLTDKSQVWDVQAGDAGYQEGDFSLDVEVNNKDKNDFLVENVNSSSQVPGGVGFICGEPAVDVRDGQSYPTVFIANQCWMKKNMNYEIGFSKCYNDDDANCAIYGRLYNWQSALGVCPSGWHLPNNQEWETLINHLSGASVAGGKMKTTGTLQAGTGLWNTPNTGATNESGFSALPGGYYIHWTTPPNFNNINNSSSFWSSTQLEGIGMYTYRLYNNSAQVSSFVKDYYSEPFDSWSVRCIRNGSYFDWSCGDDLIDFRDNQTYTTVQIGNQCWMAENLNIGTRVNASQGQNPANGVIEKYCYNDQLGNCSDFGGLYLWDEMMQNTTDTTNQGICPDSWRIPTDYDWKVLEGNVDSQYGVGNPEWNGIGLRGLDAGQKLKTTWGWYNNGNGTDSFGFGAIPSGAWNASGYFAFLEQYSTFYSSSQENSGTAWARVFIYNTNESYRDHYNKSYGTSVRCIKE